MEQEAAPIKVLVWGDSIGRQAPAPTWPELAQYSFQVSIFPGRKVEFVNISVCGLAAVHGQNLFDEQVAPVKPDYVILQFGFNDLRHDEEHGGNPIGPVEEYARAMENMIRSSMEIGAQVLVIGNHRTTFGDISVYPTGLTGWETQDRYKAAAKRTAEKLGADYIDMAQRMEGHLTPLEATADGCHLSPAGKNFYSAVITSYLLKKIQQKG